MKIFISWSGDKSKALAQALRDWLPVILQSSKPWLSAVDIEAGQRWSDAIAQELELTNFGIICVTSDNKDAPWMLFEAGALAKSIEKARVIPLLLDVDFKDLSGPLTLFQAKKTDKTGLYEIVDAINSKCENPIAEHTVKMLFEALLPKLEAEIANILKRPSPVKAVRNQDDILEELVSTVRTLDSKFEDLSESVRYVSATSHLGELAFGGGRLDSEQSDLKSILLKGLHKVTARERDILRLRHGLDDGRRRTGREVGEIFALSQSRISQIESGAFRKLGLIPVSEVDEEEARESMSASDHN